ncbi:MAG TPA: COX15/CtaA family protein [Candidatus Deferrimicrobium sp.]|nr:COX15/CtaA family protein [Candidatus Deferrimicrobium sp.]
MSSIIKFRRFILLTTAATYLLIFTGGLVRVSGAGLGCPDWPKCFGRWIPPTNINQLPADIDPSRFNITLAWIEYSNRLIGVVVGLLIALTALWALKSFRKQRAVVWTTVTAAILTAFEGWQGGAVVTSELKSVIVSVHTLVALVIVGLLVVATHTAYTLDRATNVRATNHFARMKRWIVALLAMTVAQVLLGTQMRSALETISARKPVASAAHWVSQIGIVNHIHMLVACVLIVATLIIGFRTLKEIVPSEKVARRAVAIAMALIVGQFCLGLAFLAVGIPATLQVFHLWIGSLYVGALLVWYAEARRPLSASAGSAAK